MLELVTQTQPDNWVRVVGVNVVDATGNVRYIPLAQPPGAQGVVVIALGTIESTRLALLTFKDSLTWRAASRMGENHIAHLRSNLTIRVPATSVPGLAAAISRWTAFRGGHTSTEVSALLVKGKQNIGGQDHYFHFQITASGGSPQAWNSEAQLFRKVPDMEQVASMLQAKEDSIVITIRGIGEMSPHNPDGRVGLATTTGDVDSNGRAKAFANLGDARAPARPGESSQTTDDRAVWAAMDDFADQIAPIFAAGQPFEILAGATWGQAYPDRVIPLQAGATQAEVRAARQKLIDRVHDPLGTTHHEAGTLRMNDDPAKGVTNPYGRIHDTTNCYAVGPALFPRSGSPNPMLTSVALAHRTAQMLTDNVLWKPDPWVAPTAAGFKVLFDGTSKTFGRWVRVSPGRANGFALVNGEIVTYGGSDFGLLYHPDPVDDFTLHVEFKVFDPVNQNSGVFVRFRDPLDELPAALAAEIQAKANDFNLNLPTDAQLYVSNRAWSST